MHSDPHHLANRKQHRRLLVENKLSFAGPDSALSIYDTYRSAERVGLGAGPLTYCGMVSGKKVMHNSLDATSQSFLPHESYVMPPGGYVEIDFPEAAETRPTTCLTIEIAKDRVEKISQRMRDITTLDTLDHHWEYQSHVMHRHHTADTQQLLERLVKLFTQNHPDKEIMVDLGVTELIVKLLRQQGREILLNYCQNNPDANGITAALSYLASHYQLPIDIDALAKQACMSRSRFFVEFKKQLGCSPSEYQQQMRLRNAAERIGQGHNITETSYQMGYADPSHFSRRFTQFYGISPRQYQQTHANKLAQYHH